MKIKNIEPNLIKCYTSIKKESRQYIKRIILKKIRVKKYFFWTLTFNSKYSLTLRCTAVLLIIYSVSLEFCASHSH